MIYRWWDEDGRVCQVHRSIADRDVPPTAEELAEAGIEEGTELHRRPEAPYKSMRLKQNQLNGYRNIKRSELDEFKEVNKLTGESYNHAEGSDERNRIEREISKLSGDE